MTPAQTLIAAAIALACAFAGLAIGRRKGQPALGFCLGLFLSVLGVTAIALIRPAPEQARHGSEEGTR